MCQQISCNCRLHGYGAAGLLAHGLRLGAADSTVSQWRGAAADPADPPAAAAADHVPAGDVHAESALAPDAAAVATKQAAAVAAATTAAVATTRHHSALDHHRPAHGSATAVNAGAGLGVARDAAAADETLARLAGFADPGGSPVVVGVRTSDAVSDLASDDAARAAMAEAVWV